MTSNETSDLAQAVKDSKAPAISRAAAVLRLLGKSDAPLGLNPIARELGLNPSTCLYVLRALVAEELVAFDAASKRYSLASGVLTLARSWLQRDQFAELSRPVLENLAQDFGVTVLGVQIFGLDHIVAVGVARGSTGFQLATEVGSRFPALISATGRCIAAFGNHSEARLKARFEGLRWDNPPSFDEWMAQVAQTRAQGFGVDEGNYIAGVTVLAAPVWQAPGSPSHALVAIGLSAALERAGLPQLQAALLGASQMLTRQMGG